MFQFCICCIYCICCICDNFNIIKKVLVIMKTCVRLTCAFANDCSRLIPIQLFIGWDDGTGNGNAWHLDMVLLALMILFFGLELGLGLRNTHLNCGIEWVFRDSFDAHNIVDQMLCFFQVISDPILRRLLLLTCGYPCLQVVQLLDN